MLIPLRYIRTSQAGRYRAKKAWRILQGEASTETCRRAHKGGRWFQNDLRLKKSVQYGSL